MSVFDVPNTIQPSTIHFRPDDSPEEIPVEIEITKRLHPTLSVVSYFKPTGIDSKALFPDTTYVIKSYDYGQMNFTDGCADPKTWAEESFTNEKRAYDILREFQGKTIARCYGTAWWLRPDQRRVNALIFEYIEGYNLQDLSLEKKAADKGIELDDSVGGRLNDSAGKGIELNESVGKAIADNARAAIRPLKAHGILHGDVRLANFIVKSDLSVVVLDFGSCTLDVTEEKWEKVYQDEDLELLNFELHRNEVDVQPPEDPKRFRDQYRGYLLWNRYVETEPATWRERYYRYIEGRGPYELRWDLKEDVPRSILADKGFHYL